MICKKKKYIYTHICKTAGYSIRDGLARSYGDGVNKHLFEQRKHVFISSKKYLKLDDGIDSYFKFAIVRNPYDRIVSLWLWGIKKVWKKVSFKDFIKKIKNKEIPHMWRQAPMIDWIINKDGSIAMDYIGRFETLDESYKIACNKIGIINPAPLLKLNSAKSKTGKERKSYQEYYDNETKDMVADIYQNDLDVFNYTFEG